MKQEEITEHWNHWNQGLKLEYDFNTLLNGIWGMGICGREFFWDSYKPLFFFALVNVSH